MNKYMMDTLELYWISDADGKTNEIQFFFFDAATFCSARKIEWEIQWNNLFNSNNNNKNNICVMGLALFSE